MRRYSSTSKICENQSQLVIENERLHSQNNNLMKELQSIKGDYERMNSSGIKTVKNKRNKKPEISDHLIQSQEKCQLQAQELEQKQSKIDQLLSEIKQLNRTIKKQQNTIEQLQNETYSQKQTLNEHNELKFRLEQTEKIVLELDQQLEERHTQLQEYNLLDKSNQKVNQDNQKIKSLTETNTKLNKLLSERLGQLENMTKIINQSNLSHTKQIEQYEQQIQQLKLQKQQKQPNYKIQSEVKELKFQLEIEAKTKEQLKKKHDNDIELLKNKITEQFAQIQQQDQQIKQQEQQIKTIQKQAIDQQQLQQLSQQQQQQQQYKQQQQNNIQSNYQMLINDLSQSKQFIQQLQEKMQLQNSIILQLKQANVNLNDEIALFRQLPQPLSTRTNQQLDSPFKRQNLHILFQEDQPTKCHSSKKSPHGQLYLEAEKRTKTSSKNMDKFILTD